MFFTSTYNFNKNKVETPSIPTTVSVVEACLSRRYTIILYMSTLYMSTIQTYMFKQTPKVFRDKPNIHR